MKKYGIFVIVVTMLCLSVLLGDNYNDVSNKKNANLPQTDKQVNVDIVNNDKINDVDWESQYEVIDKVKFHVLKNEYLDNNDKNNPNVSFLVREYLCFDGTGEWNQVYPVTVHIALEKSNKTNTVLDFKNQLKKPNQNSSLRLEENTIISNDVFLQWNEQKYDTEFEYSNESLKGLTYEMLQKSTR